MIASTFLASTLFVTKKIRAITVGCFVALVVVAGSLTYEVRTGDTLSAIAAANGVTLEALLEANEIPNPDLIRPGQKIVIPGQNGQANRVHVVIEGETLGNIAAEYDSSISAIAELNSLKSIDLIRIGQTLKIPSGAGAGAPVQYHKVVAGDTLASIAARYGITVEQIVTANGITDPSLIYVGTRLALSGSTFVADQPTPTSVAHTVGAGDTISSIAKSYGVAVSDIVAANDLDDIDVIRIGQKLKIPGAGTQDWVCPVSGADYVNDWGFPRSDDRFHEGTDMFAPRGTEVVAPVGGQLDPIVGDVGGFQFFLYGDDGVTYIGSHLDAFGRSGRVEAGQTIGYVGDTGNARGGPTHLHFEIHPGDGEATNPYPTLQKAGC